MVNQSVNEFYTHFIFKIDALTKNVVLPLDVAVIFFINLSTDVRELIISEGLQVLPTYPTQINHLGNQRILLIINTAV